MVLAVSVFGFRWFGGAWVRAVLPGGKKQAIVSTVRPAGIMAVPQAVSAPLAVPPPSPEVSVENGLPSAGGDKIIIDKDVCMIGWASEGGKMRVALSDGRWVGLEDGLMRVTRSYCVVQGRVYRMRSLEERLRDEERSASRLGPGSKRGLPNGY